LPALLHSAARTAFEFKYFVLFNQPQHDAAISEPAHAAVADIIEHDVGLTRDRWPLEFDVSLLTFGGERELGHSE
jgi:hypothetical protein